MNRLAYHAIMVLATLAGGALIAAPLWDFWYYRPVRAAWNEASSERVVADGFAGSGAVAAGMPATGSAPFLGLAPTALAEGRRAAPGPMAAGTAVRPTNLAVQTEALAKRTLAAAQPVINTLAPSREVRASAPRPVITPPAPNASAASPLRRTTASAAPGSGAALEWLPTASVVPTAGPQVLAAPRAGQTIPPPTPNVGQAGSDPAQASPPGAELDTGTPTSIGLLPSDSILSPGQPLLVKVVLHGSPSMSSVPFHLRFDPEVLQFVGAHEGTAFLSTSLQPVLLASVNPDRPGDLAIGLSMIGSPAQIGDSGEILELEFNAIGSGRSDLLFEKASLRGPTGEPLSAGFLPSAVTVH